MTLPEQYSTADEGTFGKFTAETRWGVILQNAIDDINNSMTNDKIDIDIGKLIEKDLIGFKKELVDNAPLRVFTPKEIETCNIPLSFNQFINEYQGPALTWLKAPWLFSEIYFYRRINAIFKMNSLGISKFWFEQFDIFNRLKRSTFKLSLHGVVELAHRYLNLKKVLLSDKNIDTESKQILFKEFIEISLWGNATDLSLLTNATYEDIKSLQGEKARQDSESKILINDTVLAWNKLLENPSNNRIDIVLDNSGFELYADFMLSLFLIQSNLAKKIVFHAKDIPYMVSDVMMKDFTILIDDLKDRKFFDVPVGSKDDIALNTVSDDISEYVKEGIFEFKTDSFWTTELPYNYIDPSETKYHGAQIHKELLNSDLVIFKGDLNYRKLTADRKWEKTTPFKTALCELATNGITLLSLRTCKADVQVGLKPGVDEELTKLWEKDHPGQGNWWVSSGKWAIICYSNGQK
ncbi:hypothetical protein TBLA_0G01830 [Henningerozyma blattae CBS 6284]|uniref:Sugar phosphate phosphatase n=1 Tax=Henningerozyma blattae (strain ATCC 34711 / CBS 6284 / DSM 70876 / NBRC 10599 / NRRL Y-10934 / UCD 77-7) TaxID=1071380 RepID=I2H6X4_HENB6|nr:hypothetical protein TBLA_0G01830 [Tetrapisispora blattae CBS 6284]CCH62126.1 hypothetical protein TBLA_0G01830 [Tetrapisispora blattae CBS 6284]